MSWIKRYGYGVTLNENEEGLYILNSDHEKVLEEVQLLWANELVKRDNEIARLRADADANRNEMARMRKVAWKIRERAASEGTRIQHGAQYVDGLRTAANMIDKSMGAS